MFLRILFFKNDKSRIARRDRHQDPEAIAAEFSHDSKGIGGAGSPVHIAHVRTAKRLEREGYIKRYTAVVDHHKMGHNVIVLCNIRLKQHTHDLIQQFMDTVQSIDRITECYNTTGDYDFQIKVYAHDMKDYQDFMLNTLGNIDCIGSLHSIIVIGEIKDSHYIPVSKRDKRQATPILQASLHT